MSYLIDSAEAVVLDARIDAMDVIALYEEHEDLVPEINFLYDMYEEARDVVNRPAACGSCKKKNDSDAVFCKQCGKKLPTRKSVDIEIERFHWNGHRDSYDLLIEKIGPKMKGEAEVVFTWEGGDRFTALCFKDGKVAECDVEFKITKPEGW